MDLVAGLTAASNAITIAKTLRGIEKDYDAATYKVQLAELISSLADAKVALSDAQEALAAKEKEIARLRGAFEDRANLVKGRGDYKYFADESGNPIGYPVCPRCEQVDGRIVQLKQDGGIIQGRCPVCSTKYQPVTCFIRRPGGVETGEDEAKRRTDAETARINEHLSEIGKSIA